MFQYYKRSDCNHFIISSESSYTLVYFHNVLHVEICYYPSTFNISIFQNFEQITRAEYIIFTRSIKKTLSDFNIF